MAELVTQVSWFCECSFSWTRMTEERRLGGWHARGQRWNKGPMSPPPQCKSWWVKDEEIPGSLEGRGQVSPPIRACAVSWGHPNGMEVAGNNTAHTVELPLVETGMEGVGNAAGKSPQEGGACTGAQKCERSRWSAWPNPSFYRRENQGPDKWRDWPKVTFAPIINSFPWQGVYRWKREATGHSGGKQDARSTLSRFWPQLHHCRLWDPGQGMYPVCAPFPSPVKWCINVNVYNRFLQNMWPTDKHSVLELNGYLP